MSLRTIGYFFIALLFVSSCGKPPSKKEEQPQAPKESAKAEVSCSVTMGWDPWEPYMYLTPGGQVSGLDIEIIQAIAAKAECDVEFVQDDWMSLLRKLEAGEVDLVAGASITEKRKAYALFTNAYRSESFVLYVRQGEAEQFKGSVKDLLDAGKKVGITTDYIYGDEVSDLQDSDAYATKFVSSSVGEANYYNLLQHNVDVIIADPFVGAYNLKRKGLADQIEQLPLTLHSGDVHLMFSIKSVDHTVVTRFNQALSAIKQDGSYDKILKKYSL